MAAYYLGLTYNQMGEYRQASKHLRDAIRLTPSVKEAYPELIQALINLNELKEAKDWMAQVKQKDVKPGQITDEKVSYSFKRKVKIVKRLMRLKKPRGWIPP